MATTAGLAAAARPRLEGVYTHLGTEVATTHPVAALRASQPSGQRQARARVLREPACRSIASIRSSGRCTRRSPRTGSTSRAGALKRFTGDFAQVELIPSFVSRPTTGRSASTAGACATRTTSARRRPATLRMALLGPSTSWAGASVTARRSRRMAREALNEEITGTRRTRSTRSSTSACPAISRRSNWSRWTRRSDSQPRAVLYVATGREMSRANRISDRGGANKRIADTVSAAARPGREGRHSSGHGRNDGAQAARAPSQRESCDYHVPADRGRDARAMAPYRYGSSCRRCAQGTWQEETPETLKAAHGGRLRRHRPDRRLQGSGHRDDPRLAEWDDHPNARGHELIAARLLRSAARACRMSIFAAPRQ